ncbi:MAG: hypothetical protein ACKVHP_26180, partial [Verrucomicrobiales bacterium]
ISNWGNVSAISSKLGMSAGSAAPISNRRAGFRRGRHAGKGTGGAEAFRRAGIERARAFWASVWDGF